MNDQPTMQEIRDEAKEFDALFQDEGDVFVMCMPDDVVMVPRDSVSALLVAALVAIRAAGDSETMNAAAKACMANLGRERFR